MKKVLPWSTLAVLAAGPMLMAILAWQLYTLQPAHWCNIQVVSEKALGLRSEDCSAILLKLLELKDHAVLGLLMVLGLSYITLIVRAVGATIKWTGPGGISGEVDSDDEAPENRQEIDATIKGDVTLTPREDDK